jgi:excisionase family DNA binding protein
VSDQELSRHDLEELFAEPVLTVEEVATRLRRHEVSVIRAIKRGELAALDGLGRPYLMTRSAVIAWALGADQRDEPAIAPSRDAGDGDPDEPNPTHRRGVTKAAVGRRRAMAPKRGAA